MRKIALLLTLITLTITAQAQTRLSGIKMLKFEFPGNLYRSADTIHYSYTGSRNSDNGIIQYDTAMHYKIDSATAALIPYRRNIQTFNSTNQITTNTLQIWNGTTWINDSRILLTYAGTQLTDSLYQGWVTGVWTDGQKWTYSYQGPSRDSMHFFYKNGSSWFEAMKGKYTYTLALLDTIHYYKIDPFAGWVFSHYDLYIYSSGMLDTLYNTSTEPSKCIYQYNSNLKVDTMIFQVPSGIGQSTFINRKRYAYTYNSDNKIATSLSDSWFSGGWTRLGQEDSLIQYSYEEYGGVSIKTEIHKLSILAYPNPTNNILTVNVQSPVELEIIDALGRSKIKSSQNTINCSDLPDGVYFLKIRSSIINTTLRILVAH